MAIVLNTGWFPLIFFSFSLFHHCENDGNIMCDTFFFFFFFFFLLGYEKDDAKLKKCVSTRYATVLILLTVKCEYYRHRCVY